MDSSRKKIMFLTNPEFGQLNVQLSTAYALLHLAPDVDVHFVSHGSVENDVRKTSNLALKTCTPGRSPIHFHAVGPSYTEALKDSESGEDSLFVKPGFWEMWGRTTYMMKYACPWKEEEYAELYEQTLKVLDDVKPDLAAVDSICVPSLTAVRTRKIKFHILMPNSLKEAYYGVDAMWKYPGMATGYSFPLPWHLVPANILYQLRLAVTAATNVRFKATKQLMMEKHSVNAITLAPIDFISDPEPGLKYIVAAAPELDFPFPDLGDNVIPCGPIMKPFSDLSTSDPELSAWLKQGPTIFINLGSHRAVDENLAVEMAKALRFVLASAEEVARRGEKPEMAKLQILWKLKQTGMVWFKDYKTYSTNEPGTKVHDILGKEIDGGRIRILPWITAEPISIVDSGLLVHGAPASTAMAIDDISSCGNAWMPRNDVKIAGGTDTRRGYSSAVQSFCSAVDGQVVEPGGYLSMSTEVFLNGGKNPTVYGILGFVDFEVHNKIKTDHKISAESCRTYLLALSAPGGKCSGEVNSDTKGGTWQVGNNGVSYHALANQVPPKQDAVNKLFRGRALETQSVNKKSGAPLSPWPFNSLNSVKPTVCHSHNDYDRQIPLFSALSAGCIAFEADVWYSAGDVIIGHILPTPGRTLKAQYVDPLRAILDFNNNGFPGSKGVYASNPSQSIVLMVDFKTSDSRTLDAVVKALQPLRDGGYLSRVEGGKFVEKQVTVVASGSSSFDRINSGDGVPNRDIFYDAKVDGWDSKFTSANSYYASANFKDAIGNPGSASSFTQAQKDKVRSQVEKAHSAGLKVRYYDLPGEWIWESLRELGVDRLNADDMSNTARLRRL
ncbi:Glycosyltransferase sdnJ [Paramyrothecium foliicola]|nr:Glycosyltransferase sdnJ [Paramyrothecium foliicola]